MFHVKHAPCIYNEHRTLSYLLPIMDYPANSMSSLSVAVTPAPSGAGGCARTGAQTLLLTHNIET